VEQVYCNENQRRWRRKVAGKQVLMQVWAQVAAQVTPQGRIGTGGLAGGERRSPTQVVRKGGLVAGGSAGHLAGDQCLCAPLLLSHPPGKLRLESVIPPARRGAVQRSGVRASPLRFDYGGPKGRNNPRLEPAAPAGKAERFSHKSSTVVWSECAKIETLKYPEPMQNTLYNK